MRTALVLGSTGLVGSELLRQLLDDPEYSCIHAATRRPLGLNHPKLKEFMLDFDRPEDSLKDRQFDVVFSALGTTIKKAGSRAAFYRIDHDFVLNAIRSAFLHCNTQQAVTVSAAGACPKSWIFYNRVKGELEQDLMKLDLPSLIILRPALLLGDRDERRTGEDIGKLVMTKSNFLFKGFLKKYKPVEATAVATAMVSAAADAIEGITTLDNDQIHDLAEAR